MMARKISIQYRMRTVRLHFVPKLGTIKGAQAKINVIPNSKPKFMKARTVPFAMKEAVELEIGRMENEGILKSVPFSEWARPIVIVPKSDGRLRICGDYKRTVNPCLDNDTFPQPTSEELFSKIHVGKKFSKIDLSQAYLQMQLEEQSQKYLTINTSKGLRQYTRMPYGVKPASGIFQRFIENKLRNIPCTVVKIDDILITGENDEEKTEDIEKVLEILNEVGATVNKSKCLFFANEIEYIGFLIEKNGIRVNPRKIDPIINMPQPTNVKQLQSFLGAVNYYSKFIPNMADIAKHLYKLIEKNAIWEWKNECDNSFRILKQRLSESPVLSMYNPDLPLKVDCDASKYGLGAVLSHKYADGTEKPIAYASRTLNKNEINYSQVDKEGASIILALKKI